MHGGYTPVYEDRADCGMVVWYYWSILKTCRHQQKSHYKTLSYNYSHYHVYIMVLHVTFRLAEDTLQ